MATKAKVYCFALAATTWSPDILAIAVDGQGEVVASHVCTNASFARCDLGITSKRKHEIYDRRFGPDQWELEWVDDPQSHDVCRKAMVAPTPLTPPRPAVAEQDPKTDELERLVRHDRWNREWMLRYDPTIPEWDVIELDSGRLVLSAETAVAAAQAALSKGTP